MKTILSTYDIPKSDIIVRTLWMPHSSYKGKLSDAMAQELIFGTVTSEIRKY